MWLSDGIFACMTDAMSGIFSSNWHNTRYMFQAFHMGLDPFIQQSLSLPTQILLGSIHPIGTPQCVSIVLYGELQYQAELQYLQKRSPCSHEFSIVHGGYCCNMESFSHWHPLLYPRPTKLGQGAYWIHFVRPSVSRQHGFRSITTVCFGISISNFCACCLRL